MGNRIKVGNKELNEDSTVTTNIKTIFWFLGIVSSIIMGLLVYFYLNLNATINENKQIDTERLSKIKQEVLLEVKEVSEDIEAIEDDVWEIKGDVKLLLDRTTGTVVLQPIPTTTSNPTNTYSPPVLDSLPTPTNIDPSH
jgi:hypothetical protein|tara:strand:+ start:4595 stop:5014 length:420 start_codon:yes stop_codon:yes gene_type:complete